MKKTSILCMIVLLLLVSFPPNQRISADTGPKPTMSFSFVQGDGANPLTITSGILLECAESDCSDGKALEQLGPQHFRCEAETCEALSYGFSNYHKLQIQFSDGVTRESNVFETEGFDSSYTVTIEQNNLQVKGHSVTNPTRVLETPVFWGIGMFVLGGLCLLGLIIIIVVVVVLILRRNRKK